MYEAHHNSKPTNHLKNVLAVDNGPIMLKFLTRIMEKAGLNIVTAKDGVTAIDLLESYTPDIFFIDLVMPNIDGRALCRIIRTKKKFKKTPIVIVSAIAAEEAIDTIELGANVCIAKVGFSTMEPLIFKFLHDPELLWDPTAANRVLGAADLSPRNITSELLTINRHFRVMLESISNGIIEVDRSRRIIFANPAALEIFCMPSVSMLGSHISQLFNDKLDARFFSKIISPALKNDDIVQHYKISMDTRLLDVSVVPSGVAQDTHYSLGSSMETHILSIMMTIIRRIDNANSCLFVPCLHL